MIRTMIRRSLNKNRLVSVFVSAFLALSAALLSGALFLALGVFGTVDSFMDSAQTPHFMQMHQGSLDRERMEQFVNGRDDVVAWEAIEFLNVENSHLSFAGQSLDTEIQQTGFVAQPEGMDYLLSPDGEVIDPQPGQIFVPYYYEDKYNLQAGEEITLRLDDGEKVFTIGGAFRDSQMNSTLASSKRLLISDVDMAELKERVPGDPELLLSLRLNSPSDASGFEAAYFEAGLENNGPSLTWSLFRLINAINDSITMLLFMLMSAIIMVIAFLCIRYTLQTTIEEDIKEIGVMKALGIRNKLVSSIYQGKYRVLLASGAIIGFLASLLFRNSILANVRRNFGDVNYPVLGIVAGFLGAIILYAVSMLYVRRVLGRLNKISALDALQGSASLSENRKRPKMLIPPSIGAAVSRKMAWAKVRFKPSQHVTILVVAALITLTLLIPFRFGATARSADFVTHMGMGEYDVRIDLLGQDDAITTSERIYSALEQDPNVEKLQIFTHEIETVHDQHGVITPLRIDYGDPTIFPIGYSEGRAPETQTELGISEINAERLEVGIGDIVEVEGPDGIVEFTVTGIYQDITNGGKTAKTIAGPTMDDPNPDRMIAIQLTDGASAEDIAETVDEVAPGLRVIDNSSYMEQMLGDLLSVMDAIAWVFSVVAVALSALIAALAIRLMLVQDRKSNAIQGALGFTSKQLRFQYLGRILLMMVIGGAIGLILATPIGNIFGNAIFSTVGLSGLSLKFNLTATVLGGIAVLLSALIVTLLHTRPGFNANLSSRL